MLDLQQGGDEGMATGLFNDPFACVDQDDGQAGGGCPCHHVSGVLDVSRGVGNDELPLGSGKVAIGDINRDPLFTFGTQSIGQQGEIDDGIPSFLARCLHCLELIFEDGLAVIEQSSNECAFAIIDASCRGEAQEVHVQITCFHNNKTLKVDSVSAQ